LVIGKRGRPRNKDKYPENYAKKRKNSSADRNQMSYIDGEKIKSHEVQD
jgi:hypothetical protein